jgi:hypothetical protein
VSLATDRFHGARNGKKYGMKLNIAVINVEEKTTSLLNLNALMV